MSASPKLIKQIRIELDRLTTLLNRHPGLLEKCGREPPSALEIDALAAMLHACYTGIENIFKRINIEFHDGLPGGAAWHIQLLDMMALPTASRPAAVISEELRATLRDYLNFRHLFRHAYAHELRWNKMESLVLDIKGVLTRLEHELQVFLETTR